jgi:hypothetical protein
LVFLDDFSVVVVTNSVVEDTYGVVLVRVGVLVVVEVVVVDFVV